MPRKPQDEIPQTRLVYELRLAVDRVRHLDPSGVPDRAALRRLRELVARNPSAVRASHVRYNLGRERAEWLDAFEAHATSLRT